MYDVLIVEDDPMVSMINKQYVVQNSAFRVCGVCSDGVSALEFLEKNKTDLIILDQYMPRMNGLEFLHEIRKNNNPAHVIMVTAANDSKSVDEALRLGIVDYLVKPFSSARFEQALNAFLARVGTINDSSALNQRMIDNLINISNNPDVNVLPKGIQEITLNKIREYLKDKAEYELTSDVIADDLKISRVTVRRYMSYLIENHEIVGKMNYETGGRPSMLYRYIK